MQFQIYLEEEHLNVQRGIKEDVVFNWGLDRSETQIDAAKFRFLGKVTWEMETGEGSNKCLQYLTLVGGINSALV